MQPGNLVGGRFEIEREVGSGGMGTVFRARDLETGASVALKVLHRGAERERFEREAQLLAGLDHVGIVQYVAHGASSEELGWLAMQWLDGEDLEHRLRRERLTVRQSVELGRRVAAGLGAAHDRGVVHRDLKPGNLLLEGCDLRCVKIIDFGLALYVSGARRHTKTGFCMGTPEYMAPEQARGERVIDARVDVFSLGCVLFECVTGAPPFTGGSVMAVLAKVLFAEAPSAAELRPEVPSTLDDLLTRMLSKDRVSRPADGRAVLAELEALGQAGVTPAPESAGASAEPTRTVPRVGLPTIVEQAPASLSQGTLALGNREQRHVSIVMLRDVCSLEGLTVPVAVPAAEIDPILAVVRSFDGQAEQLVDGSVVVFLRAIGTATDQAARAAACALELRAAAPLALMAVATGRAETGRRVAIGEAIDRASALLRPRHGNAQPQIRIDETTCRLLDARFLCGQESGDPTLEGRREGDDVPRTLCGKPTPCVGRDGQLAALEATFDECVRESAARAVLVTAGPGVGKSRLRHEFLRRLRGRGQDVVVWTARGEPVGAGSAFGLASQAVRRTAGILEGEPMVVKHAKLRARLTRYVDGSERDRVALFLGEMLDAPFPEGGDVSLRAARADPILMGDQIRRAFEDFVGAECAAHPLLFVLEDLHWGDRPSVMLVDSVLRWCSERPLMVLALGRPEVEELFGNPWKERGVQHYRLATLSRRAAQELARSVLGETTPDDVVTPLVDTSAGNAFYLEELLRARIEGHGDDSHLPETAVAMVESRLAALPDEARRVIRGASIFGQVFWEGGVSALLGEEPTDSLKHWLDELVRREVVTRRQSSRFLGQTELSFRHALVREGAYSMLTDRDRALGHGLAAQWLEGAGETLAIVLAEHLEQGDQPALAAIAYRRAAEQALEGNDFPAAIERVERAVSLGASGELLGALRLTQAEAHFWSGGYDEAERCAKEAICRLAKGSAPWAEAASLLAQAGGNLGRAQRVVEIGEELCGLLHTDPSVELARASAQMTRFLLAVGRYDLAEALLAAISTAADALSIGPANRALMQAASAERAFLTGRPAERVQLLAEAQVLFAQARDARNACIVSINMAWALCELGAYDEAEPVLRESLAAAQRLGLPTLLAASQQNLGWTLTHRGQLNEAIRLIGESIAILRQHGGRRLEGLSHAYLGCVLGAAGRPLEAEQELRASLVLLEVAPPSRPEALAMLARVLLERGERRQALGIAREAMSGLVALGRLECGEGTVRLAFAETLEASGETDEAHRALAEARERLLARAAAISEPRWRKTFLENVPEHARTLALASEWLGSRCRDK